MFSDIAELLLDAVILLLHDSSDRSKVLITELLSLVQDPKNANLFSDPGLINCLASLVKDLVTKEDSTSKSEQASVLVKFSTNKILAENKNIRLAIESIFTNQEKLSDVRIDRLTRKIKNNIVYHKIEKVTKQIYGKLNQVASSDDEERQEFLISDVINTAKKLVDEDKTDINSLSSALVERITFTDNEEVTTALETYRMSEEKAVLITPWQGLNQMCGRRGGFALGESVSFNGLPGMHKSGTLLKLASEMPSINTPPKDLGGGIPLMLFITLENSANKNMVWWYKHLYAQKYGKFPEEIRDEDISKYLIDAFGREDAYQLIIERRNGSEFGYDEYRLLVEEYEALGYRIVLTFFDYMALIKKVSVLSPGSGRSEYTHLTTLYNQMCSFNDVNLIAQISAHQLTREASNIANSGRQNIVKMFGEHVMADSMGVQRELDMSIMIHLEYNQYGDRYYTAKRDKHRYVDDTPLAHQYFAYKFEPWGLPTDVHGDPLFVRDIYNVNPPEGYEAPDGQVEDVRNLF